MATTVVDVVMPQMGVSVSEGTILKWLKQEGETIEADEPLLEISTDKVDTEVPSPGSGVVQQILVQEGETVAVGTRLAVIAPEGAAVDEEPPPDGLHRHDPTVGGRRAAQMQRLRAERDGAACEASLRRLEDGARVDEILVDVGEADPFIEKELRPELLEQSCAAAGIPLTLRRHAGYDHSYYFISTFMADHVGWHAERLNRG